MKPVLTKHFSNTTVNKGENVTFTCETQVDALPVFLFYKLDKNIFKAYHSGENSDDFLFLEKYTKPLQNKVLT